jgi:hypothetical protein
MNEKKQTPATILDNELLGLQESLSVLIKQRQRLEERMIDINGDYRSKTDQPQPCDAPCCDTKISRIVELNNGFRREVDRIGNAVQRLEEVI